MLTLFQYLCKSLGVQLSSACFQAFQTHEDLRATQHADASTAFTFTVVDWRDMRPVQKHMPHLEFAEGQTLLAQASTSGD